MPLSHWLHAQPESEEFRPPFKPADDSTACQKWMRGVIPDRISYWVILHCAFGKIIHSPRSPRQQAVQFEYHARVLQWHFSWIFWLPEAPTNAGLISASLKWPMSLTSALLLRNPQKNSIGPSVSRQVQTRVVKTATRETAPCSWRSEQCKDACEWPKLSRELPCRKHIFQLDTCLTLMHVPNSPLLILADPSNSMILDYLRRTPRSIAW